MISPIKKAVLSGAIIIFACFTPCILSKTIDLDDDWSPSCNSESTHTCDTSTHVHESTITHHDNYDIYTECCTNKETGDHTFNEVYI